MNCARQAMVRTAVRFCFLGVRVRGVESDISSPGGCASALRDGVAEAGDALDKFLWAFERDQVAVMAGRVAARPYAGKEELA